MNSPKALSIKEGFTKTTLLKHRTPVSTSDEMDSAFIELTKFDQSGIYLTNYSGFSEWERHPSGDELVQVIEGETTLVLLIDKNETKNKLLPGELMVVPKGVWHRFESPKGLKVLTITPPPTQHSVTKPA